MTRAIYLDMDGVLADFEAAVTRSGIPGPHDYVQRDRVTWTLAEETRDARVRDLMTDPSFWRSLPIMSGAPELLTVAHCIAGPNLFVLTALPSNDKTREMVRYEKTAWMERAMGFPGARVVTCQRSEKRLLAKPGNTLVDDLRRNCAEWDAEGGTAIIHTTASRSIIRLIEEHRYDHL